MLFDNHGRPLNYLRLAVTDRCNLRCFYCMPEEGINYLPKKELLSFEEIESIVSVLAQLGITKVRLTGGEPFVRTDLMKLISKIMDINGINDVHVTTNGVLTAPYIKELKNLGIASVNLSLDTLDPHRFKLITRRNEFEKTRNTLRMLIENGIPIKINTVVMEGKNIDDIIPLVELTRNENISVRFIEEMPFNGEGSHYSKLNWTYKKILNHIESAFPTLEKIMDPANATAYHYKVKEYRGNIGIIAAFSRTFCGSCNRIRITAQGILKTCLYDDGVLNIRDLIRSGKSDEGITQELLYAFNHRAKNGIEAEAHRNKKIITESMSTIGG
ncbi:MAG: GTP 3',8-cyclase MoaA [Bacteroidetes bacterium]|nr:GTP 3',8-cyclase MoaA [Bacteroidota bacterium]